MIARLRSRPAAWLLALAAALLLLVAGSSSVRSPPSADDAATPIAATAGPPSPGAGDPYFPDAGATGYDALSYRVAIDWHAADASLAATTTITARARQELPHFFVDLALDIAAVSVDGTPAAVQRSGFQDVKITPTRSVKAGSIFRTVIRYAGRPGDLHRGDVRPVSQAPGEWLVSGEPEAAAWWFPANDYPSDPAAFDLLVRVPAGMEAVSIGRLVSRDADDDPRTATWHWVSDQPVATYLTFLAIGQYALEEGTADGRPYVYAVSERLAADRRGAAFAALRRTPGIIASEETLFGPYPFEEIGGVVPSMRLAYAGLETQTRPVYDAASLLDVRFAGELLSHELAHMWFGDSVTVARWADIVDNEGYATWAAWAYAERHGGPTTQTELHRGYDRVRRWPDFWQITLNDPGPDHLFDTVYLRGPMMLQALRNVIGDAAFTRLTRDWAQRPGSRSLAQWMAAAQGTTHIDLTPFFDAWVSGTTVPAPIAANGLA